MTRPPAPELVSLTSPMPGTVLPDSVPLPALRPDLDGPEVTATTPDPELAQFRRELDVALPLLRARGEGVVGRLHSLRASAASLGEADTAALLGALEATATSADAASWQGALRELTGGAGTPTPAAATTQPAQAAQLAQTTQVTQPAPLSQAAPQQAEQFVQISVQKLDTLLALAGELTVTRLRLAERVDAARREREPDTSAPAARMSGHERSSPGHYGQQGRGQEEAWHRVRAAQLALTQLSERLSAEVLAARLQPSGPALRALERVVRDAARVSGKQAQLTVRADEVELDRHLLEQLRDPLIHLIRNAVDHGLESPEDRRQAGKPPLGSVTIEARNLGGTVSVMVSDDGAGVDTARVRQAAARRGLIADTDQPGEQELIDLLFSPGFSSREQVTPLSGRGVGLDVVRERVRALGGDLEMTSTLGAGSCVRMRLPLTLATTRIIVMRVGGQLISVPVTWVERVGRLRPGDLLRAEGRAALRVGRDILGTHELAPLLELPTRPVNAYVLLVQGSRRLAVTVDDLVGEQEVVVKTPGWPLRGAPHLDGAAVLGSGQIVPILNPADLFERAGKAPQHGRPAAAPQRRRRVLVAEDTLTTRLLLQGMLEDAGFAVTGAPDGEEALAYLREAPTTDRFDLLLSDVEMPRLDGLALTRAVRADAALTALPVVLLTSLGAGEQRSAGAHAGADAYLVKGEFQQAELLALLERLT